jgi:MoaA/NifB/PqqE/SkfB family radical SAM enzyme
METATRQAESAGSERAVHAGLEFSFLWLEITRKCNLSCLHCYAESSPAAASGRMSKEDWLSVIKQSHRMGVKHVQFIGGEPTIHRDFSDLLASVARLGMSVEVYSNLTHIKPALWELFKEFDVSLATSFYSIRPEIHDEITNGRSQAKTLRNIQQALNRNLAIRVGLIDIMPGQELPDTIHMLRDLGVRDITTDRSRGVGRGQSEDTQCGVDQLCGSCGYSKAAIDCDGDVFPCVFSRWLCVGNVLSGDLMDILHGEQMLETQKHLHTQFAARRERVTETMCVPDCGPTCSPICSPACSPNCGPTCRPMCSPSVRSSP